MVSFNQLFADEDLEFLAGRNFKYDGVDYAMGDQFPSDVLANARNRESLIRSGRVVAVADNIDDFPRAYGRDIKPRAVFMAKRGLADPHDQTVEQFSASEHTVAGVKDYLHENLDIETWAYTLLDEQAGQNRSTLVTFIKAADEPAFDAAALQAFVEDAGNYDPGEALEDFTVQDGLDAY